MFARRYSVYSRRAYLLLSFSFPSLIFRASVEEDVLEDRVSVKIAKELHAFPGNVMNVLEKALRVEDSGMQIGRRRHPPPIQIFAWIYDWQRY